MPLFLLFDFVFLLLIRFFVKIFITIFGWATDIFFGKLPEKNKGWFYLMIVLSFAWVYCLLAKAFPFMFYIFKDYIPAYSFTAMLKRLLYIICVVAIPPSVGLLGAKISGVNKNDRQHMFEWILKGYRYSLVLGVAMAVILVCTPIIRIKRILRKISSKSMDMHVKGMGNIYVMNEISAAIGTMGVKTYKKVPLKIYSLPTKILNGIMRELFDYVSDREFYISGESFSIYLNSEDIMLEGKEEILDRLQMAIVKGFVENDIHLTNTPLAQHLEHETYLCWKEWEKSKTGTVEMLNKLRGLSNQSLEKGMTYEESALLLVQINEVQNRILAEKADF